jgi:hypothetical protein
MRRIGVLEPRVARLAGPPLHTPHNGSPHHRACCRACHVGACPALESLETGGALNSVKVACPRQIAMRDDLNLMSRQSGAGLVTKTTGPP